MPSGKPERDPPVEPEIMSPAKAALASIRRNDRSLPENSKRRLDEKLDEAVENTFPASDPIAVLTTR